MLYSFIIVIAAVIFYGENNVYINYIYLPVLFAVEYIIVLGITLIVSAVTVYFRDLSHILSILLMMWQFLTPVFYPITMVPKEYVYLFELNPMTNIISSYRDILFYNTVPEIFLLFQSFIYGLVLLFFGFIFFGILKKGFSENL